jgi:hypothetical protein
MEDWVSQYDIAERFGVTFEAVKKWRQREYLHFPEPDGYGTEARSDQAVWLWTKVVLWASDYRPDLLDHYLETTGGPTGTFLIEVTLRDQVTNDLLGIRRTQVVLESHAYHLFDVAVAAIDRYVRAEHAKDVPGP